MAYTGFSDDFDLDDDGILRDSLSSGGMLIDDDGIIRDSFDTQSKYTTGSSGTHWTDSGLERDKQSGGSTSTLRQSDLQSYPSIDDVSHHLEESHANISDLEASKDDLSYDADLLINGYNDVLDYKDNDIQRLTPNNIDGIQSGRSSRSSFNNSLTFEDTEGRKSASASEKDLFDPEYYKQLQELGVLVDGAEFSNEKNSLNEFEELEAHVSRDNIKFSDEEDDDSGDDIEEFLRRTPTREQLIGDIRGHRHGERYHDDSRDSRDHEDFASHTRPSTANSARTIGSEPFPEISPEEALKLYHDRTGHRDNLNLVDDDADSIEFQESQQTPGDDDEIFIITSRISENPGPAKKKAYHDERDAPSISPRSLTPKSVSSSRPTSRVSDVGSQSFTHYTDRSTGAQQLDNEWGRPNSRYNKSANRSFTPQSRDGSITPVSAYSESRPSTRQGSRSGTPTNRPESVASHRSTASESLSAHKNLRQSNTSPSLSKARSQESFFEKTNDSGGGGGGSRTRDKDKMPKRLLPKPSASEMNKPLKVKSKSTTNLPSTKSGPVKPKRQPMSMSMSLVNIDIGEGDHSEGTSISEKSRTELSSKLHQEFHKRKQATELVQQLQQDYDKLLSKYAQAELTIDQLRLGATVTLHSNSPTPNQAIQGTLPMGQQPQAIQMGQIGRGVKSPSPFQGSLGVASPLPVESTAPDALNDRGQTNDPRFNNSSRTQSESSFINGHGGPLQTQDRNRGFSMENGPEGVKVGLKIQSQILDERMDSFQSLLEAGAALTHDEQEKVFDQIRSDHEKLRKDYLQYKEDYNALRRSNAAGDVNFDENKELEGELFRLGMKFDDIHEKVDEKRKQKHSERRPFQSNRLQSDSDAMTSGMSDQEGRAVDQMKKKIKGTKAGNDLLNPKENMELQKNLTRLHDEYNALMDRYRRLKQMAQTPERDKEIDNLVRKLHEICDEEPEVFRMPQELNDRTDDTSMSPSYTSNDTSLWDEDETDSERWEQLQRGEEEGRSFSRRQSEASQGRRPSKDDFSRSLEYARTENKPFTKDSEMQNGMGGSSSSLHRSDLDLNGGAQGRLHESSMSGSRDSLSSRTRSPFDSTFDRDSPTPRLPRPRRHDHPERRSNNLKKRPESGSFSSLQDSGISEHEGANGKERGATGGPLSNLPGPGTFKQMTKQRHAGDADSGFIGSMVGSEVSQMSNRQQQPSLRLRHQHSDSGSDRPRSRSSRADDTASIASSRSSRRGQKQERPSSRESSRPKTKQSRAGQTRDYTDDSYTLTTESEMSFDIPEQRSRRGADARRRQGSLERIIQEEEEERPRSITSQSSRRSQKSDRNQQTPVKLQKRKVNVSFSSKSDLSDEDVTPKPTPNQSFNESRELFSSEEDTPREIVNAPLEIIQQPQATVSVSKSENVIRPPTPSAKKEPPRPPTPGIRTPRSERSERSATPVKQRDVPRLEIEKSLEERPRSRNERPRSREEFRQKVLEDRAVGSDSDDTVQESVATAATQGSQSSDKFKMLQDEIGRLREAFHNATKQPQPIPQPMPPMQPPQQPQNQDQYFDPTEDPYAFMRGPRRRANSFSGAAGRDWDEWWRHPLTQQQDDIPLGYAAADSYNQNRRANPDAVAETRSRRRMRRRYRKPVNEDGTTQNNYDSDQAPSQVTASNVTDERLFNYYVPQYSAARTQTSQVPQGYYPPQVSAPRLQHYSSQPNLLQNTSFQAVPQPRPQPQPQQQNVPTNSYATPISAGYSRLRPAMQSPQRNRQVYSYDDLDMQGHQPVGYIITQPSQGEGQSQRPPPPMYVERTAACPLCGGAGYHTHGDSIYEVPPAEQPPVAYLVDRTPRVRVRPRSKSASRVRHYSPVGRIRSRYLIRDISTESSSTESDDDIIYRQRSRTSRRRTRSHRMRKYRKSREFEDALNESLNLTEEIDALTHKCIGKVSSELAKSKKKKDFGSSYW